MKFGGTQSGWPGMVKKNEADHVGWRRILGAALLVWTLAACASAAGGWRQLAKNEALTRADFTVCKSRAEQATLELKRSERSGYGALGDSGPGPFNPRGDNTMAIAERSDTSKLYEALVASCMTRKGYARPDGS